MLQRTKNMFLFSVENEKYFSLLETILVVNQELTQLIK